MNFLLNLLFVAMVMYSGLLLWLIIGNIFSYKKNTISEFPPVSIIVSIRNGENALHYLIKDLSAQKYPGKLEFILVDDESTDATSQIIHDIAEKDKRFIYETSINGDASLHFKKRALDAGINAAQNEWMLFTDVDCFILSSWVSTMANYFSLAQQGIPALGDTTFFIARKRTGNGQSQLAWVKELTPPMMNCISRLVLMGKTGIFLLPEKVVKEEMMEMVLVQEMGAKMEGPVLVQNKNVHLVMKLV